MSKIERLTPEQKSLIPKVRDEWINFVLHSGKQLQFDEIEEDVTWIYSKIGMPKPLIIIMDSYLGSQLACNLLVENQVWNQVWNQVRDQVENQVENQVRNQVRDQVENQVENQVRNQVGNQVENQVGNQVGNQVWNQVWNQVENQVWNQVENQVRDQVENQVGNQVWNQVRDQVENQVENQVRNQTLQVFWQYFGLAWESYWSWIEFFARLGIIDYGELGRYVFFIKKGVYNAIFFEKFVVITRLPTKVLKDENGRLHSTKEPAVQWVDHLDNYFIHGVSFDFELWEKISKNKLPTKEALNLPNIEQRTVALQAIGYDKVLKDLKAKTIDKHTETLPSGNEIEYKVIECDLKDEQNNIPARFVQVQCPSTMRKTLLRVDPRDEQTKTCRGAIAWTFGLKEKDYAPEIEA